VLRRDRPDRRRASCRATAIADKAGKLLKIGRRDILEVLRRDPPLATKLLWNLARELGKRARGRPDPAQQGPAATTRP
jgi:CRP-like cAMP-binding protein